MSDFKPVTEQDLEDAANMFLMSVNAYIGFGSTGLEVAGAAHTVLALAVQNLNKQHEQTTGIGEIESSERVASGSEQIQTTGENRRIEESSERVRSDEQGTDQTSAEEQREDAPAK